ncbi:MAG: hypothetical protein C0497_13355 [Gemmatimonas sp.]|nr:hypothetical protein [Gemmatimonas sp.]
MNRAFLTLVLVSLSVPALGAQQYVLSREPKVVISGEADPSAQFTTLLGVARFASGEIALGTYDPVGINLYSGDGSLVRKLAAPGEGPGEMRMPQFFGRRVDSLVTFDLGLRRMTYFTAAGARRARGCPSCEEHPDRRGRSAERCAAGHPGAVSPSALARWSHA